MATALPNQVIVPAPDSLALYAACMAAESEGSVLSFQSWYPGEAVGTDVKFPAFVGG